MLLLLLPFWEFENKNWVLDNKGTAAVCKIAALAGGEGGAILLPQVEANWCWWYPTDLRQRIGKSSPW